ncbi:hypothetical protein ASD63_29670 [Ensifer sp. Root558]|jgi:hypothetical protein|nr:hypothetical protein ASD63_29670 [Ensifer sp. Root558]
MEENAAVLRTKTGLLLTMPAGRQLSLRYSRRAATSSDKDKREPDALVAMQRKTIGHSLLWAGEQDGPMVPARLALSWKRQ